MCCYQGEVSAGYRCKPLGQSLSSLDWAALPKTWPSERKNTMINQQQLRLYTRFGCGTSVPKRFNTFFSISQLISEGSDSWLVIPLQPQKVVAWLNVKTYNSILLLSLRSGTPEESTVAVSADQHWIRYLLWVEYTSICMFVSENYTTNYCSKPQLFIFDIDFFCQP